MKNSSPTVRELIERLGGGTAVADELNNLLPPTERRVDREAVYKWGEANQIPHYRRLYVAALAIKKNQQLPDQLQALAAAATEVAKKGGLTQQLPSVSKGLSARSKKSSKGLASNEAGAA